MNNYSTMANNDIKAWLTHYLYWFIMFHDDSLILMTVDIDSS